MVPAKDASCIDDPPLPEQVYPDALAEARQRVMDELKTAQHLHCQFAAGNGIWIYGETHESFMSP